MSLFKDKVLLITGGTGSFGNAVLRRFLDSDVKEIRAGSELRVLPDGSGEDECGGDKQRA